jgi:hypothetical protein
MPVIEVEKKQDEVPDHVKVMMQQRKHKDAPVKDDAN